MVKLRLSRFGHKNSPVYRIVAANAKSKREGKALDYVGTYDPKANPNKVTLNKEKVEAWLKDGAIPTPVVKDILIKEGFLKAEKGAKKDHHGKPGKKKQAKAAKEAKAAK